MHMRDKIFEFEKNYFNSKRYCIRLTVFFLHSSSKVICGSMSAGATSTPFLDRATLPEPRIPTCTCIRTCTCMSRDDIDIYIDCAHAHMHAIAI
jgi:hypothetical protein